MEFDEVIEQVRVHAKACELVEFLGVSIDTLLEQDFILDLIESNLTAVKEEVSL